MVAGQNGQSSTYAAPHVTTERRRGRARALTRSLSTTGVTARARTRRARPVSWSTVQSTVSGCRGPNGATARMCVAEGFRADLASFWLKCTEENHARETLRKCRLATNNTARVSEIEIREKVTLCANTNCPQAYRRLHTVATYCACETLPRLSLTHSVLGKMPKACVHITPGTVIIDCSTPYCCSSRWLECVVTVV